MNTEYETQQGFTIIEMIVTIVVAALFFTLFFQVYVVLESQRVLVARQARASDVAYSNLRKFTARPAGLACDSSMDLAANNNATGKLLGDQTNTTNSSAYGFIAEPTSVTRALGTNATQTVLAFAPSGCTNFANEPIKIVSTVTYGINGDKVTHASYIK